MKENVHTMYVSRRREAELLAFIRAEIRHKNVLLVEGARQVGKSWLVAHALAQSGKKSVSINFERDRLLRSRVDACDDFADFEALLADETAFTGGSDQILFIDEAQESTRLGRFVRFMKEEWPCATVILTGSSLTRLFRGDIRFPVGRVRRFVLAPFGFSEYLNARGESRLRRVILAGGNAITASRHRRLLGFYDEFLVGGGLPAVVCGRGTEELSIAHARIIADYQDDFRRILGEDNALIAEACLRAVANHLGNASKNTSVVPGASGSTSIRIQNVFSRLEAWHFMLRSDQLSPSPEQSHNHLPKRYLFDTGLARHLREAAVPSIGVLRTLDADSRKPLGGVLENQIAIDLAQRYGALRGWKKSPAGMEIDFVVKHKGQALPIECKATLSIGRRHLRGLRGYLDLYDLPLGVVFSFAPREVFQLPSGRRVVNLPAYMAEVLGDPVAGISLQA